MLRRPRDNSQLSGQQIKIQFLWRDRTGPIQGKQGSPFQSLMSRIVPTLTFLLVIVPIDDAALHYEGDFLQGADVGERIARNGNNVSEIARL
jgi:hypothetical protein